MKAYLVIVALATLAATSYSDVAVGSNGDVEFEDQEFTGSSQAQPLQPAEDLDLRGHAAEPRVTVQFCTS
jgi:hypothetical protein